MIAFDIDGVFIPNWSGIGMSLEEYLESRYMWDPLFEPRFPYCMITGRPAEDKEKTLGWINKTFKSNPPACVYHDNTLGFDLLGSIKYKAWILNRDKSIKVFVESDIDQVVELKKLCHDAVEILHFESMIGVMNENLSFL